MTVTKMVILSCTDVDSNKFLISFQIIIGLELVGKERAKLHMTDGSVNSER